jgi:branched-subunit amino acid ABC-type transport system permease component
VPISTFIGIDSGSEVLQAVVNGVINGSAYGLLAVGFALILSVTGRFHFAYALTYALAAFLAAVLERVYGLPLLPAAAAGLAAAALAGVACDVVVYRPLAERAGSGAMLTIFVASLGILIAGENALSLAWGPGPRNLTGIGSHSISVGGATFTTLDIVSVVLSAALCVVLWLVLIRSGFGREIKAVRANAEMSTAIGIDVRRVHGSVFVIGSLLGGVAALLYGLKYAASPDMGEDAVFYALVVTFLAVSSSSPLRLFAAGVGVGLVERVAGLWLSPQLSTGVVFVLLLAFLSHRSLQLALGGRSLSFTVSRRVRALRGAAS